MAAGLDVTGWARFGHDPATARWARAALGVAERVLDDPVEQARWLQCEGTWFVGVDALPSATDGSVAGVPLAGPAIRALGVLPDLHPAQLSAVYPGYPRPRTGESAAAFRFRRDRDAAHVDGVLAEGPARRRFLREPHAFILGLPLTRSAPDASPLAVWEGSHRVMAAALRAALADHPRETWGAVDVTEAYVRARALVFETCQRTEIAAEPGEAMLLHRLTVHGISPWRAAVAGPRIVAYFRPPFQGGLHDWLTV